QGPARIVLALTSTREDQRCQRFFRAGVSEHGLDAADDFGTGDRMHARVTVRAAAEHPKIAWRARQARLQHGARALIGTDPQRVSRPEYAHYGPSEGD